MWRSGSLTGGPEERIVRFRDRAASSDTTRRVDWSAGGGGRVLSRPAVGARPPELGTAALASPVTTTGLGFG
jgi:hypothetical protein